MKKFNNLMIIGDSFCASRHSNSNYDWPVVLGKMLDCTVSGRGHGGSAWWTNKLDLDSYKEDPATTILIVVHTDSLRLPNDYGIPMNVGEAFSNNKEQLPNLRPGLREIAASFYKSDLFCPDFYHWAQQAWIKELDADTRYYTTIHIPGFDSVDLSSIKNGIFVTPGKDLHSLRALSDRELEKYPLHMYDPRKNHFSDFNNVKFATALASIILKLQPGDTGERNFDNLHEWEFYQKKS
jgi:hypothetical protein